MTWYHANFTIFDRAMLAVAFGSVMGFSLWQWFQIRLALAKGEEAAQLRDQVACLKERNESLEQDAVIRRDQIARLERSKSDMRARIRKFLRRDAS